MVLSSFFSLFFFVTISEHFSPCCLPSTSSAGSGRVNLVPLPSVVTSPRDMALAAVICSALATVVLALLILCVIYCKRQLLEKKPSGQSRCTGSSIFHILCVQKKHQNKSWNLMSKAVADVQSEVHISVLKCFHTPL